MLGAHIRFLAQVDRKAAKEKKGELMRAIGSLSQMPQRFPFFDQSYVTPNRYHKMFVKNWYLVLYQILDDVVYINYVLDCREDYSWLLE